MDVRRRTHKIPPDRLLVILAELTEHLSKLKSEEVFKDSREWLDQILRSVRAGSLR
jgi:hypothetical protein